MRALVEKLADLSEPPVRDGSVETRVILVIQEDADNREVLVRVLERAGYATIPAENEADALERLKEVVPHLILLNLCPPKDAEDFQEHLSADPKLRDVPLVILSTLSGATALHLAAGADAYFEKPVDLKDLLETLPDLTG